MARVIVEVTPKPEILDPQGKAIAGAAARLGLANVAGVRQGKRFELDVRAADDAEAVETAREMAERLLANPVMEEYTVRIG